MSVDFIDSNVFVYLFDETDPHKRQLATDLVYRALVDGSGAISFQVIQETLNIATRRLEVPLGREDAKTFLSEVLEPLWKLLPTRELYEQALEVQEQYRYSFYDSLIIAAALKVDCRRLLSEGLQDGQKIGSLTITNPFTA